MRSLQTLDQGKHLANRIHERFDLGQLRPDMHLNTLDLEVLHSGDARVKCLYLFEGNPELVFIGSGRDLGMRFGVHIWIHTHRNRGDLFQTSRDTINALKLRNAFHVEGIDTFTKGEFYFLLRFANARKDTLIHSTSCRLNAHELSFAHGIIAAALLGKRVENTKVGIGFDRVADQMIEIRQSVIQSGVMIDKRLARVDVQRASVFTDELAYGNILTIELAFGIPEMMHGGYLCRSDIQNSNGFLRFHFSCELIAFC